MNEAQRAGGSTSASRRCSPRRCAFIERFKAQAAKAAQVQSRVKKLDKIEKVEPPKRRKQLDFEFRPPPRSGDDVVKLDSVHKATARA